MELSAAEIWNRALELINTKIDGHTLETWLLPAKPLSVADGRLEIGVPSKFFAGWIESHHAPLLKQAVRDITGLDMDLVFTIMSPEKPPFEAVAAHEPQPAPAPHERRRSSNGTYLNPKYTFQRFVVGGNNKMTHAAALAVAEKPARVYNPLFIYGGVGLGKTHVMQAIGNHVLDAGGPLRVWYVSAENFMNEMIYAIKEANTIAFRNKYRGMDLLLIDDVQFLAGKESTQEEFFHTFNTLYDAHKQIVLTSDRPPKNLIDLEERLVSRFEWGLVTDIQPPDFETRVAILRKKADDEALAIPDDVFHLIADSIKSNIRELEGSLVKLVAVSSVEGVPITPEFARETLKDILKPPAKAIAAEDIKQVVARHFKVPADVLVGRKRTSQIALPRQVAMYLARMLTNLSLADIGASFGKRDHTTVIHACDKVGEMVKTDADFKAVLDHLIQEIKQAA
ncbi:MAG: chromosomal replication initiator protein DnaA [bacterium]